jgi:hypothetical protein
MGTMRIDDALAIAREAGGGSFRKGDRVKLSAYAKRRGIGRFIDQERLGTVVSSNRYVVVNWDGLSPRTVYSYHPDFIVEHTNGDRK